MAVVPGGNISNQASQVGSGGFVSSNATPLQVTGSDTVARGLGKVGAEAVRQETLALARDSERQAKEMDTAFAETVGLEMNKLRAAMGGNAVTQGPITTVAIQKARDKIASDSKMSPATKAMFDASADQRIASATVQGDAHVEQQRKIAGQVASNDRHTTGVNETMANPATRKDNVARAVAEAVYTAGEEGLSADSEKALIMARVSEVNVAAVDGMLARKEFSQARGLFNQLSDDGVIVGKDLNRLEVAVAKGAQVDEAFARNDAIWTKHPDDPSKRLEEIRKIKDGTIRTMVGEQNQLRNNRSEAATNQATATAVDEFSRALHEDPDTVSVDGWGASNGRQAELIKNSSQALKVAKAAALFKRTGQRFAEKSDLSILFKYATLTDEQISKVTEEQFLLDSRLLTESHAKMMTNFLFQRNVGNVLNRKDFEQRLRMVRSTVTRMMDPNLGLVPPAKQKEAFKQFSNIVSMAVASIASQKMLTTQKPLTVDEENALVLAQIAPLTENNWLWNKLGKADTLAGVTWAAMDKTSWFSKSQEDFDHDPAEWKKTHPDGYGLFVASISRQYQVGADTKEQEFVMVNGFLNAILNKKPDLIAELQQQYHKLIVAVPMR